MITMYGIPNCDTVKKSRNWLKQQGIEYSFHDYKKYGISRQKLTGWLKQIPLETLLNKKGMTFRNLNDAEKAKTGDIDGAIDIMVSQPSIIKRPLLEDEKGRVILIGFDEEKYANALK
ncbi:MAG: ArsC family reductase [Saprospiraceae bacterium]|nr:ArsC family reductase [Saprospiraceae bacterium]